MKNRRVGGWVGEEQLESVSCPVDLPSPLMIVSWRKCEECCLFALRELRKLLGRLSFTRMNRTSSNVSVASELSLYCYIVPIKQIMFT